MNGVLFMTGVLRVKYLFLLGCSLVAAAPAWAQDEKDIVIADQVRDDLITVVATGNRLPIDQSGQSISIIGADEIKSVQGADLTRVLERLPGVTFNRNGGLGNFTGLRVRGADAEQLLVLVDGVRMADVAAPLAQPGTIGKREASWPILNRFTLSRGDVPLRHGAESPGAAKLLWGYALCAWQRERASEA